MDPHHNWFEAGVIAQLFGIPCVGDLVKWDDPPSRADRRRLFPTARAINRIKGSPILSTQEVDENGYCTNPLFFIEGQYSLGILKPCSLIIGYCDMILLYINQFIPVLVPI